MMIGSGASFGIAIGNGVCLRETSPCIKAHKIEDFETEKKRLSEALEESCKDVAFLLDRLTEQVKGSERDILAGHLLLLEDPYMREEFEGIIRSQNVCAEYAVEEVCEHYGQTFASMDDPIMRQRKADVDDIKLRIQGKLLNWSGVDLSGISPGSILIAKDLLPSLAASIDPCIVSGIVTQEGGCNSHFAILARALKIPAVVAVEGLLNKVRGGEIICLDGESGQVEINPDAVILEKFTQKQMEWNVRQVALWKYKQEKAQTKDGCRVHLHANIASPKEAEKAFESGADGVGLFRTEFLFMRRTVPPTEEEQFEIYSQVVLAMQGKPVVIRTLDAGGDKGISYLSTGGEDNPYLGYRAIRICLDRQEDIFKPQLRALLRAGALGEVKILLPMITCLEELRQVKALMQTITGELEEENLPYGKHIQLGVMIETPSSVIIADLLAEEADFFSIGTNDLTQYTMAADRGNSKVSALYSWFQPSVLRSIQYVIQRGNKHGISVAMCGEAAADQRILPLLLAFGLREFSVNVSSVLDMKERLLQYDSQSLGAMEQTVMAMTSAGEILEYIKDLK